MTEILAKNEHPVQDQSTSPRKFIWILIITALAVAFSFQGSRGLFETSEGRYAECAREMMESGNYFEPTLDYAPHWTKPPLTYWAIALGYKEIGHGEWGLRFFHAVAFLLSTLAVAWIGATLWDRKTGTIAGLIYTTSIFPVAGAYSLTTDMLLAFWEIYAVLCFIKACGAPSPGTRKAWILAMYACLGLGFLTKGPPALIPLLPILLWRLKTKRPAGLANPLGIFLFAVIGLTWYLLVIFLHPELFSYFIGTEIIDRITSNAVHNHSWFGPIKVYAPVLLLGGGIWSIYGIRFVLKKHLLNPRRLWHHLKESPYEFFLVSWIVLALVIFVIAKSRLPLYILPLHAPITLLIARGFTIGSPQEYHIGRMVRISLVSAVFLICLKGASVYFPSSHNMKALYDFCRETGGEDTKVVEYYRRPLYGLQYYLSGHLESAFVSGTETWADASIDEIMNEIEQAPSDNQCIVVASRKDSDQLARMINDHGNAFEQREYHNWIVFIVHGVHIS